MLTIIYSYVTFHSFDYKSKRVIVCDSSYAVLDAVSASQYVAINQSVGY